MTAVIEMWRKGHYTRETLSKNDYDYFDKIEIFCGERIVDVLRILKPNQLLVLEKGTFRVLLLLDICRFPIMVCCAPDEQTVAVFSYVEKELTIYDIDRR